MEKNKVASLHCIHMQISDELKLKYKRKTYEDIKIKWGKIHLWPQSGE